MKNRGGRVMRSAAAYLRGGKWFLHSDSKTTDGVWIASAPFLYSDSNPESLGEIVVKTLLGSSEDVPHPTNWSKVFSPMLDLSGCKSWNAFTKGASLVSIEMDGASISLTPYRNLGPKEGFEPIEVELVLFPLNTSAIELGEALNTLGRVMAVPDRSGTA
jgi:hypothetical protein